MSAQGDITFDALRSCDLRFSLDEPLAQSVEHLTFNQVVGSSSLPRLTKKIKKKVNMA